MSKKKKDKNNIEKSTTILKPLVSWLVVKILKSYNVKIMEYSTLKFTWCTL